MQAIPALAEVALPIDSPEISANVPTPCAPPSTTTTSTVLAQGTTVPSTTAPVTDTTVAVQAIAELPRTGSSSAPMALVGVGILAAGAMFVGGTRRRSR